MKRSLTLTAPIIVLCLALTLTFTPAPARGQDASAELPVMVTSCGQSPGPVRIQFFMNRLKMDHEFNMELLTRYNEEGIEFAIPTQTLYVKQDSDLAVDVTVKPRQEGPTN